MDYAANGDNEGGYMEIATWVAGILGTDPNETYKEYTSGDWMTGEEVYNGVLDGTVTGYYEFQQELMLANPDNGMTETVPVENYVALDLMTEAGESLYA